MLSEGCTAGLRRPLLCILEVSLNAEEGDAAAGVLPVLLTTPTGLPARQRASVAGLWPWCKSARPGAELLHRQGPVSFVDC